uniref:BRCT domain-containing protein n=2 Tax=Arion vulgaris TaxID=1028688 RepID=A0A0B7AW97_9EUPU
MFTGYLDGQSEKVVTDLGGVMATSVKDCTHLVTDRICRTVKFLSGLAKGLQIVSPQWLESSKQAGTFLDGHMYLVSDPAMEKQYKFNLATSLSRAQTRAILTGYRIHVTKSVKPDPVQMQEILKFTGAKYLKTMPNKYQENTVVISCSNDHMICQPAIKAGIPVMEAEFVLTGILRQELDFESYLLFQDDSMSETSGKNKTRKK